MKRFALMLVVCILLVPMCAQARLFNSDHEEFKWQLADHLETYIDWVYGGDTEGMHLYYGIADHQPMFMMLLEEHGMCGVNVTEFLPKQYNQNEVKNLMNVIDIVVNTVDMHYYHSSLSGQTVDALLAQILDPIVRDRSMDRYYYSPGEYTYSSMGMNFYQNIFYSSEDDMYVYSLSIFPF